MAKKRESVEDYMAHLDHPLKAEIEALREIIKGVSPKITEEIKWNAPSYRYKDYLATFNLRTSQHVHLVFHNPHIANISSDILEGDYIDRRMAYFADMQDVEMKKAALEAVIRALIARMDE